MPLSKQQHLDPSTGPKRILSLDGGGIRGILTLEYLSAIENMLRKRSGRDDFLLCDYFDLIGGTSTGSIIAAGLACGMPVDRLKQLYRDLGRGVFVSRRFRKGIFAPKFHSEPVQKALDVQLGADTTLDSDRIRTGLMVMAKRLDTGSPWPLHNHPNARYAQQDGKLWLTQVVRASTAAPTYFEPETIEISSRDGKIVKGAFVDGGVSPFNDPALQALMLAVLEGHGFRWQTGKDKLLLISLGTGTYKKTFTSEQLGKMVAAEQGIRSLQSLMDDCARMNHCMLQWLTHSVTPWQIDRVVLTMEGDSRNGPQLATFARYNVLLEPGWMKTEVEIEQALDKLAKIAEMDDPTNMDELADIGRIAAAKQVKPEHFPASFDVM
jgi:predicted patatin/cPLA2 family phospholipase